MYQQRYKVIVIGAGIAGLSTVNHLVNNGIKPDDILVLEARNRIGGRIHTVDIDGQSLDLGAHYVHGACSANSVFNLANK